MLPPPVFRTRTLSLLVLAGSLLPHPARAQPCLGLPHEAGDHDVGARVETETGQTVIAIRYAGSSRALAWGAYAGGVGEDLSGFPGDYGPAVGAGLAWVGASRALCPTLGLERFDEGSDRDVSIVTAGLGAGFSTVDDPGRFARAIVYAVPQVRWVRRAIRAGGAESADTDRQYAVESGVTVTGRRLWAGGGARIRYRDNADYPLDAVLLVRGGVRW